MNNQSNINDNHSKTVLIVDDTIANLDLLISYLGRKGYKSLIAKSGQIALERAERTVPDLILLDIQMPGMDGFATCEQLKNNPVTSDIPVIFMTALSDTTDKIKGFNAGAVDYITKPIDCVELLARVDTHIALHSAQKDLKKQNELLKENAILRDQMEQLIRHDLKTPLSGIIMIPQVLLKKGKNLTERQVEQIRRIKDAGDAMLQMINRYLDIYKMEKGVYTPRWTDVDIIKVLQNVLETFSSHYSSAPSPDSFQINGNPVTNDDSCYVQGEEMLIYSLFSNILKNAFEATTEAESVFVSVNTREKVNISVSNKGSVPENIRNHFFEKFITSGKKNGVGLGTYSAKLISETLNGAISLDCSEEDRTTVKISLLPTG